MNKNTDCKKGVLRKVLKKAHDHTIYNREEIEKSGTVYCISCQESMAPSEITEFVDEGRTGLCPHCGMDALIGEACGIQLTDTLLKRLHKKYFTYDDVDAPPMHKRHKKNGIWMFPVIETQKDVFKTEAHKAHNFSFILLS